MIFDIIVNTLISGSGLALITVGLSLLFGVGKLINFAHGEFFMVGAFLAYFLLETQKVPYAFAMAGVILAMAILGLMTDRIAVRPIQARGGNVLNVLISTMGLSLIIQNGVIVFLGTQPRFVQTPFNYHALQIGGVSLTMHKIIIIVVSALLFAAVWLLLSRTRLGVAMRAVAQDAETARLMGIDVKLIVAATFALSAVLAGISGILMSPLRVVDPLMGMVALLKTFVVVIVGGLGSVSGAIMVAYLVSFIEGVAIVYLSGISSTVVLFVALFLILLVRPKGLVQEALDENV